MKRAEKELIKKFLKGEIPKDTPIDIEGFENKNPQLSKLRNQLSNIEYISHEYKKFKAYDAKKSWKAFTRFNLALNNSYRLNLYKIASIAAIFIIVFSVVMYTNKIKQNKEKVSFAQVDVPPGVWGASLILSNGDVIKITADKDSLIFDSKTNFQIQVINNCLYYKSDESDDKGSLRKELFHTIQTSSRQEISVILPDGTKVWLNSDTQLRFPVPFNSKIREVDMIGEAFFDVAKNKNRTFTISSEKQTVTVKGTQFSIASYPESNVDYTILLEGSVEVKSKVKNVKPILLIPNQEAVIDNNEIKVKNVNAKLLTSWRYNLFAFDHATLESVTRKLSRWYGVEFQFNDTTLKEYHFTGVVPKYENISKSLDLLELTADIAFTQKKDGVIIISKE